MRASCLCGLCLVIHATEGVCIQGLSCSELSGACSRGINCISDPSLFPSYHLPATLTTTTGTTATPALKAVRSGTALVDSGAGGDSGPGTGSGAASGVKRAPMDAELVQLTAKVLTEKADDMEDVDWCVGVSISLCVLDLLSHFAPVLVCVAMHSTE